MNCNRFFEALNNLEKEDSLLYKHPIGIYYSKEAIKKFFSALDALANDELNENFSTVYSLRTHYQKHVLSKHDNRKSNKHTVFYDFMPFADFQNMEQNYFNFNYDKDHLITVSELECNDVLPKVDNLFDNHSYLVIEGSTGKLYIINHNSITTSNYSDNTNVYDYYVKENNITKTFFPVHKDVLLNRVFSILFEEYNINCNIHNRI